MNVEKPTSQQESQTDSATLRRVRDLWAMARLGHEGMMMDKIQRGARIAEVASRFAMTGDSGEADKHWPEDDEMGVSIGNEIHHHYSQTPPHNTADRSEEDTGQQHEAKSQVPSWKRLAAVAVLSALTGGGAAALIPLLTDDTPESRASDDTHPSRYNSYDIEKFVPEE